MNAILSFDPSTAIWKTPPQPGQCQWSIGGSIDRLRDWQIPCSKRARYDAIVHFTSVSGDAYAYQICGQHLLRLRNLFQIDADQLPGWKKSHRRSPFSLRSQARR